MEVCYEGKGFTIRQECGTFTEAFGFLGDCKATFSMQKCGACGSADVSPEHRKVKGYDFYACACNACGCKLKFGITKEDHALFPKRKADNGEWLPNGGWVKDDYSDVKQAAASQPQASRQAPAVPF